MMRREPMKRIKRHIITIIFSGCFLCFLADCFPPVSGLRQKCRRPVRGGSVTIDGVHYQLMDLSSGSMGYAELDPGFHSVGSLCEK